MINKNIISLLTALGGKDNLRGMKFGEATNGIRFKVVDMTKVNFYPELIESGKVKYKGNNMILVKVSPLVFNKLLKNWPSYVF